jgi:hypothetical protein
MKSCPICRRRYDEDSSFCPHDGARLRRRSAARVGAVLGESLRLDSLIGQGAMGVVYGGLQLGIERNVAVKLLHPELADDPELRARFLREARATARLSSPHIATVHLVGETDDGVPYMELVDGVPLEDLAAAGPMAPSRAADLGHQIALALADAHDAGIIHRDLKPSNVMVCRRHGAERAVVLDFGIAKLDDGGPGPAATREGAVFGTPGYLAPEQAQGHPVPASDLYSLGVILYRLLTGRLPFSGDGVDCIVAHMVSPPPPLPAWLDGELADLVHRCLAKEPAARPSSAEALASLLLDVHLRLRAAEVAAAADDADDGVVPRDRRRPSSRLVGLDRPGAGGRRLRGAGAAVLGLAVLAVATAAVGRPGAADGAPDPDRRWPISVAEAGAASLEECLPGVSDARSTGLALLPAADRRSLLLSSEGLAMRAQMARRMLVGQEAEVVLDLWGKDGEPVSADALALELSDPAGARRPIEARSDGPAGRFAVVLRPTRAGDHVLSIRAAGDDGSFDLVLAIAPPR